MARTIKRRKPGSSGKKPLPRRILGWILRGAAAFVLLSLLWVVVYRFVPPPVTMMFFPAADSSLRVGEMKG